MEQHDHVRDWLKRIGALIMPSMSADEFTGRINTLAPDLAAEFPPEAFTPDSARAVARACRYFPNFAEACDSLAAWWRANRFVQLPPPAERAARPEPPTEGELQHVSRATQRVVADLRLSAAEKEARAAARLPPYQSKRGQLSRAELTEAYKRAGVAGPQVSEMVPAQVIPLRRSP